MSEISADLIRILQHEGDPIDPPAQSGEIQFYAKISGVTLSLFARPPSGVVEPLGSGAANLNPTATITTPTTLTVRDLARVDPSGGPVTVTLPIIGSVAVAGDRVVVKNITASPNAITVATGGSNTIDGAASASITVAFGSLTFVVDSAANWSII